MRIWRLAVVLAACTVLAGTVHFVHAHQVRRQASVLLDHATRNEEQGDRRKASEYLSQYLVLVPRDIDAFARFALFKAELATGRNSKLDAAMSCDRVLSLDTTRNDVRVRQVQLWLEIGRFADAVSRAEELLDADSSDRQAWLLLAKAHQGLGKYRESAAAYDRVVSLGGTDIDSYVALAYLCREKLASPKKADRVMDAMVEQFKESAKAYVARSAFRLYAEQRERADEDLKKAIELAPTDSAVIQAAAESAIRNRDFETAVSYLQSGIEAHPENPRFYDQLARVYFSTGEKEKGTETLRLGMEQSPHDRGILFRHGWALIDSRSFDEADRVLETMRQLATKHPQYRFLQARLLQQRGDISQAAAIFESTVRDTQNVSELQSLASLYLGQCYQGMGQLDLALTEYKRAIQIEPQIEGPRIALASVFERMGRLDEAVAEYEKIVALRNASVDSLVRLGQAYLRQVLQKPKERRAFDRIHEVLAKLDARAPDQLKSLILQSECLLAQGEQERSVQILQDARERHGQDQAFWLALASAYSRSGAREKAAEVLHEAMTANLDTQPIRMARAAFLARAGRSDEARSILEDGLQKTAVADGRIAYLEELVAVLLNQGNLTSARKCLTDELQRQPDQSRLRLMLLDVLFGLEDLQAIEAEQSRLRESSIPDSVVKYVEARRSWLKGSKESDPQALKESRRIINEIKSHRPQWEQLYSLLGRVEESLENVDESIKAYSKAQELGERNPDTTRRLTTLLAAKGRYTEINPILERLRRPAVPMDDLQRFSAEAKLRAGDVTQAIRIAEGLAASRPSDYRHLLWMGQLLGVAGKTDEAEQSLRKATLLRPDAPETWAAMVQFYRVTNQMESVKQIIHDAASQLKPDQAVLAVPRYYELAGMVEEAEKMFDVALQAQPQNVDRLQTVAEFYMRIGKFRQAEASLRRALALKPESASVRRSLAMAVASQRNYAAWDEAVRLVDQNLAGEATDQDKHAKAILLAMRPSARYRKQAVQLLEELTSAENSNPDDLRLLAELYYRTGQADKGRQLMIGLLNRTDSQPALLAGFVNLLLKNREFDEAERWLSRLESSSDSDSVMILRARILHERGQDEQAVTLLRESLDNPSSDPKVRDRESVVARVLTGFRWSSTADQLFQSIAGRREEFLPALAFWRRAYGRVDSAMAACRELADRERIIVAATTGVAVLNDTDASPQWLDDVEHWMDRALEENAESMDLRLTQALFRHIQGRHQESVKQFEQLLTKGANPIAGLNNLAWVLSEGLHRPTEALPRIQLAIQQFGPHPNLLDTRGMILLRLGRLDEAVEDLETVTADSGTATRFFHLAVAYYLAGKKDEAKTTLEKAKQAGSLASVLRESVRKEHSKMLAELSE